MCHSYNSSCLFERTLPVHLFDSVTALMLVLHSVYATLQGAATALRTTTTTSSPGRGQNRRWSIAWTWEDRVYMYVRSRTNVSSVASLCMPVEEWMLLLLWEVYYTAFRNCNMHGCSMYTDWQAHFTCTRGCILVGGVGVGMNPSLEQGDGLGEQFKCIIDWVNEWKHDEQTWHCLSYVYSSTSLFAQQTWILASMHALSTYIPTHMKWHNHAMAGWYVKTAPTFCIILLHVYVLDVDWWLLKR